MTRTDQPDDDAFVARLRSAYGQAPRHTEPLLPPMSRTTSRSRPGATFPRWRRVVAVGAVVAAAAAVPLVAGAVADREPGTTSPAPPVAGSPTASPSPSADVDAEARRAVPGCRPDEVRLDVGDDVALPGERRGRVVTLRTQGDRTCRVPGPVRVTTSVGPAAQADAPRRGRLVVTEGAPYVVAPGADVTMMISSPTCPEVDVPRRFATRFDADASFYGYVLADDVGSTGTCGGLALDWVVGEGLDPTGAAYALTARVTVPGGLVVGERSRVVATIRNPTDEPVTVPRCALRVLPGQGLVVAPTDCDEAPSVLEPGGSTTQVLTPQVMDAGAGSYAFTVDGVAAPVRVVTVR